MKLAPAAKAIVGSQDPNDSPNSWNSGLVVEIETIAFEHQERLTFQNLSQLVNVNGSKLGELRGKFVAWLK